MYTSVDILLGNTAHIWSRVSNLVQERAIRLGERHLCLGDTGEVRHTPAQRTYIPALSTGDAWLSTPARQRWTGLRTRRAEAAWRERLHFEQPSPPHQFLATQATRRAAPPNDAPPPPRLPRPRTPLPMGGRRGRAARAASAAEAAAGAGQGLVRVRYRRGRRGPRRQSCAHRREDGPRGSQGPRRPSRRDSSLTRHGPKSALWEKRNTCLS